MLPILKDGIIYPLPKVVYRMFDYTDVPEVSSCTVDRYWNVCSFILQRKKCCCRRGCILQGNCNINLNKVHIKKYVCYLPNGRSVSSKNFDKPVVTVFHELADPKMANNIFIFSCSKLVYKWVVYVTLSLNWLTCMS